MQQVGPEKLDFEKFSFFSDHPVFALRKETFLSGSSSYQDLLDAAARPRAAVDAAPAALCAASRRGRPAAPGRVGPAARWQSGCWASGGAGRGAVN